LSAAAGLALLTLIAQVESAGQTRVQILNDCPEGMKGFYTPTHNRIGLCRNNHSSDQPTSSAQQAANAALGSSALVIGRPITS
tara:strand:+ start:207 stop:455 length:249 start_codon:yes stop_codon:yes gene_type:complete